MNMKFKVQKGKIMSCSGMEKQMLPFVDGRLKASEVQAIEKHLATCAACRLRVNEFRAVSHLIDELPLIEPSEAFDLRVHARVAAEPVKKSWWVWYAPSPRVAFATSMLLLAVIWLGSKQPTPDQAPSVDSAQIEQINNDLPVLENYDVISNFAPLTELPQPVQDEPDDSDSSQSM
jgi:anti-sigma factor RsiW